ncbi:MULTISPECIES: hypothetical protein [unclassified Rickettsia]|uniref:hypothetical protein n=1 Tax=unclassified Rickettsia TaxID=114295 RepID=UPI003132E92C
MDRKLIKIRHGERTAWLWPSRLSGNSNEGLIRIPKIYIGGKFNIKIRLYLDGHGAKRHLAMTVRYPRNNVILS